MQAFFRRGTSKISFLPTMPADPAAPTPTELDSGTDLSEAVQGIDGFQYSNTPIDRPNLAASFTPQIPGSDAAPSSSLTFSDDKVDDTIRTALAKDTTGALILLPYGMPASGESIRVEVWPVTSTGYNDQWSMDDTPAAAMCAFAVTSPPEQNASLTAA